MRGDCQGLKPQLLDVLTEMELELGRSINITSGYRPEDRDSSHSTGLAADLEVEGGWARLQYVRAALKAGVPRIGVYSSHVHVDVDTNKPHPVLWSG